LKKRDLVRLCLVVCDLSNQDLEAAKVFFRDRGVPAEIIVVDEIANRIRPIKARWPRAAYVRLYFDSIFGDSIGRLIYFDADTRIRVSLDPLLDISLNGAPVGAVHDFIYYLTGNIDRRRRDLFLAADAPYLQSGVMIFDWPATLKDGGLGRARDFLETHGARCYDAPDQDAINAVFEGKWTPIDPRWNLHECYLMLGGALEPYVEHYTSSKPWSRQRPPAWRNAAAWYARELAGSKWSDFVCPQSYMDVMRAHMRHTKYRCAPHVRDFLWRYVPAIHKWLRKSSPIGTGEILPWAPKYRRDVEVMVEALIEEAEMRRSRLLSPESILT
jgi:lipopolysaccharide biosynthesis glycosyltransferase